MFTYINTLKSLEISDNDVPLTGDSSSLSKSLAQQNPAVNSSAPSPSFPARRRVFEVKQVKLTGSYQRQQQLVSADCTKNHGASFHLQQSQHSSGRCGQGPSAACEKAASWPLFYFRQTTLRTIKLNNHVHCLHRPTAILVGELESPAEANNGAHWSVGVLKINSSAWQVEDQDWFSSSPQSVLHSHLSLSTHVRATIHRRRHFD